MNERLNWMLPSFEITRVGSLQIRISLFLLLLAPVFMVRFGWTLGLAIVGILMASVFLHELGHVCLARWTGGSATEIQIAPFGGLAVVQPGRGTWSQILTVGAGPFVNLVICLAVFPGYYAREELWGILNPLEFPVDKLHDDQLLKDLGLLTFTVNWILLLINVLPILPLDGGRIVRTMLLSRMHPELVDRFAVQVSMIAATLLSIGGLFGNWALVVFLGGYLVILNLVQFFETEAIDREDDSFLGYDFSEGYTSLDRSAPPATASQQSSDSQRGLLEQWRERRRQQRAQALRRQQEEAERQLDELLAKVHEHGMGSLTAREQQLLRQVSDLLRERGKGPT